MVNTEKCDFLFISLLFIIFLTSSTNAVPRPLNWHRPNKGPTFYSSDRDYNSQKAAQRASFPYGPSLYSRNNYGNGNNVYGAVDKVAAPVPYYGATTRPYEQPITYYGKPIPLPSFKNTSPAQSTGNAWGGYQPGFYRPVWDDDYTAVVQNLGSTYATLATSRDIYVPRAPPPVYGDLGALSQHPFVSELVVRDVLKGTALGDFRLIATTTSTAAPTIASAPVLAPAPRSSSSASSSSSAILLKTIAGSPSNAVAVSQQVSLPPATVDAQIPVECIIAIADPRQCFSSAIVQPVNVSSLSSVQLLQRLLLPPASSLSVFANQNNNSQNIYTPETLALTDETRQLQSFINGDKDVKRQSNNITPQNPSSSILTPRSLFPVQLSPSSSAMQIIHIGDDSSMNITDVLRTLATEQFIGLLNKPVVTIVKTRGAVNSVLTIPTRLLRQQQAVLNPVEVHDATTASSVPSFQSQDSLSHKQLVDDVVSPSASDAVRVLNNSSDVILSVNTTPTSPETLQRRTIVRPLRFGDLSNTNEKHLTMHRNYFTYA